jgi:hypothetical protein
MSSIITVMSLTVSRRRERIKRYGMASMYVVLAVALVVPAYQGDAVKSPSSLSTEPKSSVAEAEPKAAVKKEEAKSTRPAASQVPLLPANCNNGVAMRPSLSSAQMPQLRQLARYESLCASRPVSKMSFFLATPTNQAEAQEYATYAAKRLKEMSQNDVAPLVFFEPSTQMGVIDLSAYANGQYDQHVDAFFASIKNQGVNDSMMGTWVPVPEGNTPQWSTLDPTVYGKAVTKSVQMQKRHFPSSKSALLLDSVTYGGSPEWDDGKSVSLAPYLSAIQPGIIDSFGLQGLPWVAAGNASITNGPVSGYMRHDLAVEAAKILNVREVWFNTGSFGRKYVGTPKEVSIADGVRATTLQGVVGEASKAKAYGFDVSIHLFAENKSAAREATDWSYWSTPASQEVLKRFIQDSQKANLGLWLYDTQR